MTVLIAKNTRVVHQDDGSIDLLAPRTNGYASVLGTHEEIRALAYRIIEAADRIKAAEWEGRVNAALPHWRSWAVLDSAIIADLRSRYTPSDAQHENLVDTTTEQDRAYLVRECIDPDFGEGPK